MDFVNTYTEKQKKKNGVYYTPEDISLFMASKSKEIDDGVGIWLDPCCGLGILSICLATLQSDPVDFIQNRLVINEIDGNQLKIAQQNFYEKFGVIPKSYNQDFLKLDLKYDYIIMNPPYFKYEKSDIYAYFLNKASNTTKGFISINPLSYTNGKNFETTRSNILKFKSISLYHFDNIPGCIFKDASVRVSIIVTHNKFNSKKTTGLIRWKTEDRVKMINSIETHIDDAILTSEVFYKTPKNTKEFISTKNTLSEYVSDNSNFPLYIASSPRYFLSASTERLDRVSQLVIYMKDLESYNNALILLNSSYLYWWWRTVDSSMSLTKKTLLSLPWLCVKGKNQTIIEKIKNSEINNKVYKLNAGRLQENVKHPKKLLQELNLLFLNDKIIEIHN